ncbi:MAG TPA: YeeE/YedE family protein [Macromonas sp.]|nr:YeeE/YedE family protein [Macromonas sp.]
MSTFRMTPWRFLAVLLAGMLFGFGLALSTMVQPEVVLSFLRFQDFGLMLVMGGAAGVTLIAYRLVPRLLKRPLADERFHTHPSFWNRDTLIGSAIFGIGWGLCGVCPGPAIAGLGTGNWPLLWALAGIALGALVQGLSAKR